MLYYDFPLADSLRSPQILTKYFVNVFINSFTRYSLKAEMDSIIIDGRLMTECHFNRIRQW